MAHHPNRWDPAGRASAYVELEHPADLFLEIRGGDPEELLEHALFAFYDQIAELDGFRGRRDLVVSARGAGLDQTLRALLSEALYHVDTEGFVAVGGEVTLRGGPQDGGAAEGPDGGVEDSPGASDASNPAPPDEWRATARLWGDTAQQARQTLLHEVKAVTYHRLSAAPCDGGWKATVLLDI
jgi:SHS2 domain-containing protein